MIWRRIFHSTSDLQSVTFFKSLVECRLEFSRIIISISFSAGTKWCCSAGMEDREREEDCERDEDRERSDQFRLELFCVNLRGDRRGSLRLADIYRFFSKSWKAEDCLLLIQIQKTKLTWYRHSGSRHIHISKVKGRRPVLILIFNQSMKRI